MAIITYFVYNGPTTHEINNKLHLNIKLSKLFYYLSWNDMKWLLSKFQIQFSHKCMDVKYLNEQGLFQQAGHRQCAATYFMNKQTNYTGVDVSAHADVCEQFPLNKLDKTMYLFDWILWGHVTKIKEDKERVCKCDKCILYM